MALDEGVTFEERQKLADDIAYERGTLAEAEAGLQRLKESLWWFNSSDAMLSLERAVEARSIREKIEAELTPPPTRAMLVEWVRNVSEVRGSEAEGEAYIGLLDRYTPHPAISDLIFYPETEMNAEEIVDAALNYKPIVL